jgi:hypothetical protein
MLNRTCLSSFCLWLCLCLRVCFLACAVCCTCMLSLSQLASLLSPFLAIEVEEKEQRGRVIPPLGCKQRTHRATNSPPGILLKRGLASAGRNGLHLGLHHLLPLSLGVVVAVVFAAAVVSPAQRLARALGEGGLQEGQAAR